MKEKAFHHKDNTFNLTFPLPMVCSGSKGVNDPHVRRQIVQHVNHEDINV